MAFVAMARNDQRDVPGSLHVVLVVNVVTLPATLPYVTVPSDD
jgi:hypothetical protein